MNRTVLIIIVIAIVIILGIALWPSGYYSVADVPNGNTIVLDNGATVHLIGVGDSPEAKYELQKIKGEDVELVPDRNARFDPREVDGINKLVDAYVLVVDNGYECINASLIRNGFAPLVEDANLTDSLDAFRKYAGLLGYVVRPEPSPEPRPEPNPEPSPEPTPEPEKHEKCGPGKIITITEKTFNETVAEGLVLVDFSATWCGWCKKLHPVLEEIAKENACKLTVAEIDADKSSSLVSKYNIDGFPHMILFKNGNKVEEFGGYRDKEQLMSELHPYM